ncbi:MAG: DNA polymerase III subunit delta' [Proteobacteria bacterium]|nr:DNA polymerase III subunit delta' [Pseudomonadota bacterium]
MGLKEMRFAEIRSQEAAVDTLRRALAARKVPHAYLFSGPPGVGKHIAAQTLAMALNCRENGDDACGICLSCSKVLRKVQPDVFEVGLPEKGRRIPIDTVRDLERRLAFKPHEGRAKVAIIDPADLMTEPAANALLKTLEEPRQGSFLVLISSRVSSLLATVRSRCQLVRFRPLPEKIVADLLEAQGVDPMEAAMVAALSGGSMEQAAAYLSEELDSRIEAVFQILESALEQTPNKGFKVAASLSRKRNEVLSLLDLLTIVLSEVLWLGTHPGDVGESVLVQRLGERLLKIAHGISVSRATGFIAVTHRTIQRILNNNMNPQLALENVVISMRGRADEGLAGSGFGVL